MVDSRCVLSHVIIARVKDEGFRPPHNLCDECYEPNFQGPLKSAE